MKRRARVALAAVLVTGCGGGNTKQVCRDACPSSGQTQCVAAATQTCVADAQGCLAWGPSQACASGACNPVTGACSDALCQNTCSAAGQAQCAGTGIRYCLADSNGCLVWGAAQACPSAGTCNAATSSCTTAATNSCGGVTTAGLCDSATSLERCLTPTGGGEPQLVHVTCGPGESCEVQSGRATCVLTAVCAEGSAECESASTLKTCTGGTWVTSACAGGCQASPLNAFCKPTAALSTLSGRLVYEARVPNSTHSDWNTVPGLYLAQGFMVMSRGAGGTYDVAATGSNGNTDGGQFTIQVPSTPASGDELVFVAAADDGTGKLAYCVADPAFGQEGEQAVGTTGADPAVWSWSVPLQGVTSGDDVTITVADGSGAATVFDNLRWAYSSTRAAFGTGGPPLVVWVGYGTSWDCGACFADYPTTLFGVSFPTQLWLDGSTEDQGYWADAVTEHELGHYVMWAYGTSPNEGGIHYIGVPTYPGQAWSEGWATYFSADRRDDPLYVDKQQGAMLWIDIGSRAYDGGTTWQRPVPSDGLLGLIDENEVAAMTWALRQSGTGASQAIFRGIASAHLAGPSFRRGYTQHTWDVTGSGELTNVVDTGVPVPCFADFLDALACDSFSSTAIESATQPATHYKYYFAGRLCP